MKKILFSLMALLVASTASAQISVKKGDALSLEKHPAATAAKALPSAKAQVRKSVAKAKELTDNQRYIGYDMDETVDEYGYAIGTAGDTIKIGCGMTPSLLDKYAGCKVIGARFALCQAVGESVFEILGVDDKGHLADAPSVSAKVDATVAGWNEVTFDTPLTLIAGQEQVVAFSVKVPQKNQTTGAGYYLPISGTPAEGGWFIYGNMDAEQGIGWYDYSGYYGNAMIQLLLENPNGDFVKYDLALEDFATTPYVKAGESGKHIVTLTLSNSGSRTLTSAVIDIAVDGQHADYLNVSSTTSGIGSTSKSVYGSVTLPSLTKGTHTITATVSKEMDEEPHGDLTDNSLSTTLMGYTDAKTHQKQLVEHFTSQYCLNCPYGYNLLDTLQAKRDDIAWVSMHTAYAVDAYTVADTEEELRAVGKYSDSYYCLYEGITGAPMASFNRYLIPGSLNDGGTIGISIGYKSEYAGIVADMLSDYIDQSNKMFPAFADVNISSSYDASTRELTVTVSGEGVEDVATYMPEAALTVYLTEDSLKANQYYNSRQYYTDYPHPNVLRAILSDVKGDAITWNGTSYEKTYTKVLDSQWKPWNMNIVALIANPLSDTTYDSQANGVVNCEKVKVTVPSGISNAVIDNGDNGSRVVARYTASGQQVAAPVKGLNILKLANGKTVKTVVK